MFNYLAFCILQRARNNLSCSICVSDIIINLHFNLVWSTNHIFHMLSFFIVIGLGLDYTIFNINTTSDEEMRPVMFSFLTSFVGFGLLAFTSFFLIKSMGITLGLGLALSYLISLFLFRSNKIK